MASDFGVSPAEAREQLDILESDRSRLAARLSTPWVLMTAAGAALAWFVADAAMANPGPRYEAGSGYLLAVAVLCLVAYFVKRDTGIQFRRLGSTGWLTAGGVAAWTMVMFIAALSIVSVGHRPRAFIPVLLTWIVGALGGAAVFRSCVEAARRG